MNKKIILSLLLALTLIPGIHAGKIITETLHSNILDADRDVNVYLPTGYDESGSTQYPVLYLLHGLSDDQTAWAQRGGLQTVADELILTGEMRPMVIIMPCAGGMPTTEIWNGYYNMPGWAYERFFFEELIPQIEKKFHIYGDKAHRAISGLSMGGGGSVGYCQKHPDMFSSCYAFSAWLDQSVDEKTRQANDKLSKVRVSVNDNSCIALLKNASDETKNQLKTIRWFVDCGDDDFLLEQNIEFYLLMRSAHIPCELRVRNGVHNWEYWHTGLRTSLPFASRFFGK